MKRMLSFGGLALTRSEMKEVRGSCMPAHWDVYVWDDNGNGGHVACAKSKKTAMTLAHHSIDWGKQYKTGQWKYNPGNC